MFRVINERELHLMYEVLPSTTQPRETELCEPDRSCQRVSSPDLGSRPSRDRAPRSAQPQPRSSADSTTSAANGKLRSNLTSKHLRATPGRVLKQSFSFNNTKRSKQALSPLHSARYTAPIARCLGDDTDLSLELRDAALQLVDTGLQPRVVLGHAVLGAHFRIALALHRLYRLVQHVVCNAPDTSESARSPLGIWDPV